MFSIREKKIGMTETDQMIDSLESRVRNGLGRESMGAKEGFRWPLQQDVNSFIRASNAGLEKKAYAWTAGAEGTVWCPHGYDFHCSFLTQMLNAYDMQVPGDTNMTKILSCSSMNVLSTYGRQKNKLPRGMEQGICGCTECWGTQQWDT